MTRSHTHTPRPSDLVALITFDDAVYENQAVTRERLARPAAAPHALNAAIKQWLGRGRHTWIDVRGRQINGIATARTLAADDAWVIDTLVDASGEPGTGAGAGVVAALLEQAVQGAARQRVTRILLRTEADSPVLPEALRSGFKLALRERLWRGHPQPSIPAAGSERVTVRETCDADAVALFQLYNRALPIDARQALALTLEEWQGVQERRWLGRGGREFVAVEGGRIVAALRLAPSGAVAQLDLLADAEGATGAAALLDVAIERIGGDTPLLALLPEHGAAPPERLLRERGLQPVAEYVLLSRRTAQPVEERARVAPEMAVPRGL